MSDPFKEEKLNWTLADWEEFFAKVDDIEKRIETQENMNMDLPRFKELADEVDQMKNMNMKMNKNFMVFILTGGEQYVREEMGRIMGNPAQANLLVDDLKKKTGEKLTPYFDKPSSSNNQVILLRIKRILNEFMDKNPLGKYPMEIRVLLTDIDYQLNWVEE